MYSVAVIIMAVVSAVVEGCIFPLPLALEGRGLLISVYNSLFSTTVDN